MSQIIRYVSTSVKNIDFYKTVKLTKNKINNLDISNLKSEQLEKILKTIENLNQSLPKQKEQLVKSTKIQRLNYRLQEKINHSTLHGDVKQHFFTRIEQMNSASFNTLPGELVCYIATFLNSRNLNVLTCVNTLTHKALNFPLGLKVKLEKLSEEIPIHQQNEKQDSDYYVSLVQQHKDQFHMVFFRNNGVLYYAKPKDILNSINFSRKVLKKLEIQQKQLTILLENKETGYDRFEKLMGNVQAISKEDLQEEGKLNALHQKILDVNNYLINKSTKEKILESSCLVNHAVHALEKKLEQLPESEFKTNYLKQLENISPFKKFPVKVLCCVATFLDTKDLKRFALAGRQTHEALNSALGIQLKLERLSSIIQRHQKQRQEKEERIEQLFEHLTGRLRPIEEMKSFLSPWINDDCKEYDIWYIDRLRKLQSQELHFIKALLLEKQL